MTQKELNYIEDIYNHEVLLLRTLNSYSNEIDDSYNIKTYIKEHEQFIQNLNNLMEENIHE